MPPASIVHVKYPWFACMNPGIEVKNVAPSSSYSEKSSTWSIMVAPAKNGPI